MDERSSLSLDRLRGDLTRRGLPRDYVERVVAELDDHRDDLRAEATDEGTAPRVVEQTSGDRLGDPRGLAEFVTAQYRARTFAGRHPIVMFLVAPVPVALLAWSLGCTAGALVTGGILAAFTDQAPSSVYAWLNRSLSIVLTFLVPGLVTILFSRLAYRAGHGWRWQCASCLILTLMTGTFQMSLNFSPIPQASTLTVGLRMPPHLLAMLLPLAVAGLFAWRYRANRQLAQA
jgi:hypothetical protein